MKKTMYSLEHILQLRSGQANLTLEEDVRGHGCSSCSRLTVHSDLLLSDNLGLSCSGNTVKVTKRPPSRRLSTLLIEFDQHEQVGSPLFSV